ncbi:unnamed protein product [Tetraodon nigroviridis]|uniref:(spotted green pufferfish) hypothetical protein n=1 Tax=Tetraodon nigroviridis TaxID=99883 RepID=Q4T3A4_TETNG|nr:unnamed protein product [Tetraodon nigroviridis]
MTFHLCRLALAGECVECVVCGSEGCGGESGEGGGLKEPGVAAATEVISGPMGSRSTQREQAGQVPGIKIIITLH